MEALELALNIPTVSPVAVADFKKLRRSTSSPAKAKFGNWRAIPKIVHQNRNDTKG
jgi:hypothetical protein